MKKVDFNEYANKYNAIMQDQHAKFGDINYYSEYKVKIAKNLCGGLKGNILEYGCGIGRNLPFLSSSFTKCDIFGFDISDDSLNVARQENKSVKFITENEILDNKFNNFFDLIFIAGVYHHIEPKLRKDVTQNILRIAKPLCKVIIFEHNPYNPLTRHMVNTCEFDKDAVLLTKNELEKIFNKNGFKTIGSGYSLFVPPKFKSINFIEKYLKYIPLGGQYYIEFIKRDS